MTWMDWTWGIFSFAVAFYITFDWIERRNRRKRAERREAIVVACTLGVKVGYLDHFDGPVRPSFKRIGGLEVWAPDDQLKLPPLTSRDRGQS